MKLVVHSSEYRLVGFGEGGGGGKLTNLFSCSRFPGSEFDVAGDEFVSAWREEGREGGREGGRGGRERGEGGTEEEERER